MITVVRMIEIHTTTAVDMKKATTVLADTIKATTAVSLLNTFLVVLCDSSYNYICHAKY